MNGMHERLTRLTDEGLYDLSAVIDDELESIDQPVIELSFFASGMSHRPRKHRFVTSRPGPFGCGRCSLPLEQEHQAVVSILGAGGVASVPVLPAVAISGISLVSV